MQSSPANAAHSSGTLFPISQMSLINKRAQNRDQTESSDFPQCGITLKLRTAATVALSSANSAKQVFKAKIDYPREHSETPENPLAGLLNYFPLAKALLAPRLAKNSLHVDDLKKLTTDVLAVEFEDQNIRPTSTSCRLKDKWTERSTNHEEVEIHFNQDHSVLTLRLQGEVKQIDINHDHFGEDQKLSTGGNTSETLRWVVEVAISGLDTYIPSQRQALVTTLTEKFQTQNGQASVFSRHAEAALRESLQEGKPTENVNSRLNDNLSPQLQALGLPDGFRVHFKIYRPQVLSDLQATLFEEAKVDLPAEQPDPGEVIIRLKTQG